MKLLYVSNHRFVRNKNGEYFTTGQMGAAYFDRFKKFFEQVTVIGLCEDETDKNSKKIVEKIDTELNFVNYVFIKTSGKLIDRSNAIRGIEKKFLELLPSHDRVATKAPSLIANTAVRIANSKKVPIIVEMVGCPWDAYWNHSIKGKVIAPIVWFSTKGAVKKAPYVVYVTNRFLQQRYPTNGSNTNCSNVVLREFDKSILDNRIEKIRRMEQDKRIVIGTTGAVNVRYKGQQYIIKALGKLKDQGITNFEYQLVGGGDPSFLKSIADQYGVSDQVKFLGSMPHQKVFQWLDTIDIYTQPSRQEGLPRALMEAMSRGLPSFGAATAGIPELIEEKYIFSNTKNNIAEICSILKSIEKENMIIQAKANFEESKQYAKDIIESRRQKILKEFIVN